MGIILIVTSKTFIKDESSLKFNAPTLQRSNAPTLQRSNAPTLQRSNAPTLQRSNAPTHVSLVMALLFVSNFAPTILKGQETEPLPYNPCPSSLALSALCFDGSRTCQSYTDPEFDCSENYCWADGMIDDNEGIPPLGIVENKVIEIGGTYTITQGVTFLNCIFKMHGGSRINLSPQSGPTIRFQNCKFFGCGEMWQGIFVDAIGAPNTGFLFWGNSLEDAYIALNLDEVAQYYSIADNSFQNNHIGISNLRENGSALNASIIRNTFWQSTELATLTGDLNNPLLFPMPDYPLAHAGVKFGSVISSVGTGVFPQQNVSNAFSCLVNGIVSENGAVESNNNSFQSISHYGIWATDGTMSVGSCQFLANGYIGIWAQGANLNAIDNYFKGDWVEGIHSMGNTNAEQILIFRNRFTTIQNQNNWDFGIFLSRPQASVGVSGRISSNIFYINSNPVGMECIHVEDFADATGETLITLNEMTINSPNAGQVGIFVRMGNSDNFRINTNTIRFNTLSSYANWGIAIFKTGTQSLSTGHNVNSNNVAGVTANFTVEQSLQCAFHVAAVKNTDFCDNTVDNSEWGFHFTNNNTINLRGNHINHHDIGLYIVGGAIGVQEGRGNQWNLDPNACLSYAASVEFGNALFSEFIVHPIEEGTVLPWMPPNARLNPDTNIVNWFHIDEDAELDHCALSLESSTMALTRYEESVVLGTSTESGAALWDLQREVYTKLLLFPDLRPTGSPEATYFNSLSNSIFASFGQVTQEIRNALGLDSTDQQAVDSFRIAIGLTFDTLAVLDESMDYSVLGNLSPAWFAQRAALLQQIATNAGNESVLETARNQQVYSALQNVLTYNASITTTLPYESARKTLNELRIRHLLGQPISQALYQQALTLAQQDPISTGYSTEEVLAYMAPCDQILYRDTDEESNERTHGHRGAQLERLATLQLAPNPTTGFTEVTLPHHQGVLLTAYNANGQKVRTLSVVSGTLKVALDLTQNPSGLYWIILTDEVGKFLGTAKISVLH